MLTEAGPLVALFDEDDDAQESCMAILPGLAYGPLRTTRPCFSEVMYLLDGVGFYRYQERLWRMRRDGKLVLLDLTTQEIDRMNALMKQYKNVPMDLADGSLAAIAESRDIHRLFTIDSDFSIYRLADDSVLEVVR